MWWNGVQRRKMHLSGRKRDEKSSDHRHSPEEGEENHQVGMFGMTLFVIMESHTHTHTQVILSNCD